MLETGPTKTATWFGVWSDEGEELEGSEGRVGGVKECWQVERRKEVGSKERVNSWNDERGDLMEVSEKLVGEGVEGS